MNPHQALIEAADKGKHDLTKLPGIGWGGWKCFRCGRIFKRKPNRTAVCIKEKV